MSVKLEVPSFGESITEVAIESWLKREGDYVSADEPVVNIESDKATLELPAPAAGILKNITAQEGDTVSVGDVIAEIEAGDAPAKTEGADAAAAAQSAPASDAPTGPAARRVLAEAGIATSAVSGGGPGGRIRKEDAVAAVKSAATPPPPPPPPAVETPSPAEPKREAAPAPPPPPVVSRAPDERGETVKKMTPIRRIIAERLLSATQNTAMLTTFNEIDMSRVMGLRKQWKEAFVARHGIKLGFMSFFVKASIEALKAFPSVNAEIRGQEMVFRDYFDVGVAVGGGKGLTVPVIRNADLLTFAGVELTISDFGRRAMANKLKPDELQGGTFTISNGGVYGSLLSTPILNPPQSGILGMHKIEQRPVVVDGEIVARPMMYVALTYDHRIVDGREAVGFLVRIKECIENPERILLEV